MEQLAQNGLLNSSKEQDKQDSSELVENHPLEGTPFVARKIGEQWFLTMGKYKIAEGFSTITEAIEATKDASWDMLMKVALVIAQDVVAEEIKKLEIRIIEQHINMLKTI